MIFPENRYALFGVMPRRWVGATGDRLWRGERDESAAAAQASIWSWRRKTASARRPKAPNKSPRKPAASPSRRRRRSRDDPSPRKRKRGGKRRVILRRTLYWGAVFALWALIAGIGVLIWIGIHLPPI